MDTARKAQVNGTDPHFKVGACIVDKEGKECGIGFNRMPNGCEHFLWSKAKGTLDYKLLYVCHAEMNAIVDSKDRNTDCKGGTIYATLFPCNECAKLIIQSGIKKVVYDDDSKADKDEYKASKRMLDAAGIPYEQYKDEKDDKDDKD